MNSILLAQDEAAAVAVGLIFLAIYAGILIFIIASFWKILTKAGEEGWKAIVPFYNAWTYAEIVGRPGWWGLLLFVPLVGIVFSIMLAIDLAKSFGKDPAFAVGLVLLSPVFNGILAFGSSQYVGPAGPEGRPGWHGGGGGYGQGGYNQGGYNQGYGAPQGGYQPPAGQQWGQAQAPQQPQWGEQPQQPQQPQWGEQPQQPQQPQWGEQPQPPPQAPSGGDGWGDQSDWGQPNG